MAWNKAQYITDIKAAMETAKTSSDNLEDENDIRQAFADTMAEALEDAIKTIDLTIGVGDISVDPATHSNTIPLPVNNKMT